MTLPNFFILGAPKCGSTSLSTWFSEHPQIFMPDQRVLNRYCTDFLFRDYQDKEQYEHMFSGANDSHRAIGEASVWYLYSEKAVGFIESEIKLPKYIVLLRNPLEMAPSLHGQLYISATEDVPSFEEAWRLQEKRRFGISIPEHCNDPKTLQYESVCKLGEQLERVYNQVPKERVYPILLDDLKEDPRKVWAEVLNFLGVDDDGRQSFFALNKAKSLKFPVLRKTALAIAGIVKLLHIPTPGFGVFDKVERWNTVEKVRNEISPELKSELIHSFKDDIQLLESLLSRDLQHWMD